jgi:hypothetical protein
MNTRPLYSSSPDFDQLLGVSSYTDVCSMVYYFYLLSIVCIEANTILKFGRPF